MEIMIRVYSDVGQVDSDLYVAKEIVESFFWGLIHATVLPVGVSYSDSQGGVTVHMDFKDE